MSNNIYDILNKLAGLTATTPEKTDQTLVESTTTSKFKDTLTTLEEQYNSFKSNEQAKDAIDYAQHGEYDQEGDMAKKNLYSIKNSADKLSDLLDDEDNLPEWVQTKITKALDYVDTAARYMDAEKHDEDDVSIKESYGTHEGEFDTTVEDDAGAEIPVTVEYSIWGKDRAATFDEPAEYQEIEILKVCNSRTGELVEISDLTHDRIVKEIQNSQTSDDIYESTVTEETYKFRGFASNSPYDEKSNAQEFEVKAKSLNHAHDKAIKKMHTKFPDHTHHGVKLISEGDDVMRYTGPTQSELNPMTATELLRDVKGWVNDGMSYSEIRDIVMAMVDDRAVSLTDAKSVLQKVNNNKLDEISAKTLKSYADKKGDRMFKDKIPASGKDLMNYRKAIDKMHEKEDAEKMNETTDVTDYNPKSQGGTRKELLAKLAKSKDSKHAEAARRAGASQGELKRAMSGEEELDEKAVSKKQQKFMGMVHAAQKGENPASKEVAKAAKSMTKKAATDFAKTKHKGLPAHVTESRIMEAHSTFDHILQRFPAEVKQFEKSGNMDEDLFHALYDYYFNAGEMPYKVSKNREGNSMEWVSEKFGKDIGTVIDYSNDIKPIHDELDEIAQLAGITTHEDALELVAPDSVSPVGSTEELMDDEMDEGNAFSGALDDARDSGKKEFEVDGKVYPVKEDVNINVTASGEEDVLNLIRKLSGMMPVADQFVGEEDPCECDDTDITMEVDEERDIEYLNTPREKTAPVSAAIPSGTDLNRSKQQDPKTANKAANPLTREKKVEETLWTKYSDMLKDLIK